VWAGTSGMKDPCGPEMGWEFIVVLCAKFIMLGVNYKNKSTVRSATVRGYLGAVNDFFDLRGFPIPANFADPENMAVTISNNLKREKYVATKRSPLINENYAEMKRMANAGLKDSAEAVVFNCTLLGRITGP